LFEAALQALEYVVVGRGALRLEAGARLLRHSEADAAADQQVADDVAGFVGGGAAMDETAEGVDTGMTPRVARLLHALPLPRLPRKRPARVDRESDVNVTRT